MNTGRFTKKIGNLVHHEHHDKYSRVNPYKHWKLIVVSYTILSCIVIGFSLYVYSKISRGEFFTTQSEANVAARPIDEKKLKATVDFFEAKRQKFETEKVTTPASVDLGQ